MANGFELNNDRATELGFTDVEFQKRYVRDLSLMMADFISHMYRHNYDYLDPHCMRIFETIFKQKKMEWSDVHVLIRSLGLPVFQKDPHDALYEMFVPPSDMPVRYVPMHAQLFLYWIFISLPLDSLVKISDSVREA